MVLDSDSSWPVPRSMVVKNGLKIRACVSSVIPIPLSDMVIQAKMSSEKVRIEMVPLFDGSAPNLSSIACAA